MSMTKLEELLALPFEEYMAGCWQHVLDLAMSDTVASVVYQNLLAEPAGMEALWARRYWFHKNGVST